MIWWILLGAYILIFLLGPYVTYPFMRRITVPSRIPTTIRDAVKQLERESKNEYDFLKNTSRHLLSTGHGSRFKTFLRPQLAYETNLFRLYKRPGFMHSHQLNYLFVVMLCHSKYFTRDRIRTKLTWLNFTVHQYVQVNIAGQWYDVDLWADSLGVDLGKHASFLR